MEVSPRLARGRRRRHPRGSRHRVAEGPGTPNRARVPRAAGGGETKNSQRLGILTVCVRYNANGYTNERLETRTRYHADGYTNASHSAGTGICVGASGCSSTDAGQRYLRRRVIEIVA